MGVENVAKFLKIRDAKTNEDVLVNLDWVKKITVGSKSALSPTSILHFACADEDGNYGDRITADQALWKLEEALEETVEE